MIHPRAKPVLFRGELLSRVELRRRYGLCWDVISSLSRRGLLNERQLERHLKWRAERARIRALAAQHGVAMSVVRMREARGWDPDEAATTPVLAAG